MNLQKESSIDFLDVTEKTQMIPSSAPAITNPASKIDFSKICEDYWTSKGLSSSYIKGLLLGRGDRTNIYFNEFIKKFCNLFKNITTEELKAVGETSEHFKDDFKALEHVFNMILNHLSKSNVVIKDEKTLATIQGFINSYVQSIAKQDGT